MNPEGKFSVQLYRHRAEHWVIDLGVAKDSNDSNTLTLSEIATTYVRIGVVPALENPGDAPLMVIEIQSGSYVGEDGVVQSEGVYRRT